EAAFRGSPVTPWVQLAGMPGGGRGVRSVHQMFAKRRFAGEWFLFEEPLVGFVRSVAASGETLDAAVQDAIGRAHREAQAARRTGAVRTNLLADVRAMFQDGERHVSWHLLAERLSEALPEAYGGISQEVLSAEVRAFGVRSVNGRRAGLVRKGVKLSDLDAELTP